MNENDMVIRSTSEGPAAGAFKLNAKYISGGASHNTDGLAVPAGLYLIQSPFHSPYTMNPTEQVVDTQIYERLIANVEVIPKVRKSKKQSHTSASSKTKRRRKL